LFSLVGKRFADKVRRPWKVWFFDTSKQGISALVIHFVNILLSMAFGNWLEGDADPCNWYWINLTLDDTLGVGILFILLRILQCVYRMRCVGRPELALSGEYGDPPDVRIFGRQLLDWQVLVIVEKFFLAVPVISFSGTVASVAAALLGWLDPYPRAKLVVVMVVTPLTMNVFALWVADSFLQRDPVQQSEARMRELLVHGTPSVVGRWGGLAAYPYQGELSGEESEGVVSFQEWRRRDMASTVQQLPTRRLSGIELVERGG